jgi:hypothetical protein
VKFSSALQCSGARQQTSPPSIPRRAWSDSEEKREPVSDIDTVVVDSLKALDPERPIREADIYRIKLLSFLACHHVIVSLCIAI